MMHLGTLMMHLAEKNPATDATRDGVLGPLILGARETVMTTPPAASRSPLAIQKSTTSQEVFYPIAGAALGCQHDPAQGRRRGGARMRALLRDFVLFSCLLAFVTGIVIAVASLLS